MPKKRPLNEWSAEFLKKRIKDGHKELLIIRSHLSGYLKQRDPLRVELEDLCRRYKVFSDGAERSLKEEDWS